MALVAAGCTDAYLLEQSADPQYRSIAPSRLWLAAPGALMTTARTTALGPDQRVGLVNRSPAPGDNFLQFQGQGQGGLRSGNGEFRFDAVILRAGGLPAPFEATMSGDLMTASDRLGPYLWAEDRSGADTLCVLAIRRLSATRLQLPRGLTAIDVVLRNCVRGTAEEALAPIRAESLGASLGNGAASAGFDRMLSPLAGPTPQ